MRGKVRPAAKASPSAPYLIITLLMPAVGYFRICSAICADHLLFFSFPREEQHRFTEGEFGFTPKGAMRNPEGVSYEA